MALVSASAAAIASPRVGRSRPTDTVKLSSSGTPYVLPLPVVTMVRGLPGEVAGASARADPPVEPIPPSR